MVSTNVVKLQLPTSIKIHPVVNINQIVWYKKQVGGQKMKEGKPIEIEGVEEWEVERILNKRKVRVLWQPLITRTNDHTGK